MGDGIYDAFVKDVNQPHAFTGSDGQPIDTFKKALSHAYEVTKRCVRFAEEIERLRSELEASKRESSRGDMNRAFVEVAKVVLAERTYRSLLGRAREHLERQRNK